MILKELIKDLTHLAIRGDQNVTISLVTADSRKLAPGALFVAVRGEKINGEEYIVEAMEKGARAIVSEKIPEAHILEKVTWIQVFDSREALAALACAWHDNPSASLKVIGITGTNGKTTTSFITHAIMQKVWLRAGLLGTVFVNDGEKTREAKNTTPGAEELQEILRGILDKDCRGVAMEISSHGLSQKRTDGLELDVAVFTNMSQDHLDYHGDMESYYQSKRRLFSLLEKQGGKKKTTAVINIDDKYGQHVYEEFKEKLHVLTLV